MASMTGYDLSVRQGLNQKGISNDRISYDPSKGVMVDGRFFMNPDKVYQGSSFTSGQNFNNAWNKYSQSQTKPQANSPYNVGVKDQMVVSGYDPSKIGYNNGYVTYNGQNFMQPQSNRNGTTYTTQGDFNQANRNYNINQQIQDIQNWKQPDNPYTQQITDQIKQLQDMIANQQYTDPYGTAEYAAYKAQSDRRAQDGIRAAQEALGSAGFGRSTTLGERAQGIQNSEAEYLETQVIPQIIANEQARRQQQYQNAMSLLNPMMQQQGFNYQQGRDQFGDLQSILGMLTGEDQRQLQNELAIGDMTGQFRGGNTMAQRQANWNAYMDMVNQTGNLGTGPKDNWQQLQNNAYAGDNTLRGQELKNMLQQQGLDRLWQNAQATGFVTKELASATGLSEGTPLFEAQMQLENLALNQAQFQRQLDNDYYSQQIEAYNQQLRAQGQEPAANDYYSTVNNMIQRDKDKKITNKTEVARFIEQTGLSSNEMRKLYAYAEIEVPK